MAQVSLNLLEPPTPAFSGLSPVDFPALIPLAFMLAALLQIAN
jgi:hypothetical protein